MSAISRLEQYITEAVSVYKKKLVYKTSVDKTEYSTHMENMTSTRCRGTVRRTNLASLWEIFPQHAELPTITIIKANNQTKYYLKASLNNVNYCIVTNGGRKGVSHILNLYGLTDDRPHRDKSFDRDKKITTEEFKAMYDRYFGIGDDKQ